MASTPASKRLKTGEGQDSSKPTVKDVPRNAVEQAASYALELLANTSGTRSHCLQLIIDGSHLQLWYYDAGGMIRSETMCWVTEFETFAAIIIALASLDLAGWGIGNIPNLIPPSPVPTFPLLSLKGYSITMTHHAEDDDEETEPREVKVTLGEEVFTQYSLVGRRTTVYAIEKTPKITPDPLVLKMSMQTTRRIPEYELLNDARAKGVGHLPEAHMWTDQKTEWRLSHGIWGKLFPNNKDDEYEDRCQRLIVFTRYEEVEDILSPANMHSIFAQLIQCMFFHAIMAILAILLTSASSRRPPRLAIQSQYITS